MSVLRNSELKNIIKMEYKSATAICSEWVPSALYKNGMHKERRMNNVSYATFYPNGALKQLQYDVDES